MAEYLSPGVYVDEFDSGGRPIEGVGTGTAGFIGLAEKGPVLGVPQLVTNFSEFRRTYGGYLSENEVGEYRFLAYAVEHFFINGGARCFISRVAPSDAGQAQGVMPQKDAAVVRFGAKDPGLWGNHVTISATPSCKARTQVLEVIDGGSGKKYRVKNGTGFLPGDVVVFTVKNETAAEYNRVVANEDNLIIFETEFAADVTDTNLLPGKTLSTCEMNLEVKYEDLSESYDFISFNESAPNFLNKVIAKSNLITAEYIGTQGETPMAPFDEFTAAGTVTPMLVLDGGSNGSVDKITAADFIGTDHGTGKRTGIQSFVDNDVVSIMAVPGITDPNAALALVAHCEKLASRFAILDIPREAKTVPDIIAYRDIFESSYAALYHPWLEVFDPLDQKNVMIPPSGSMAGIFARSDHNRGVHKAPANEVVKACVGLDCQFGKGEQDILNPQGVNLIRAFPGQGIRVWGARTATSDSSWKYVNVRRLFIFIEESIKASTSWVVLEPNDEVTWVRVQRTISMFLTGLWRNGSLAGSSPEEAFFVDIGRSTMSRDDIDNGRLIGVIGVAPVKPAEFMIFRITQKTGDSAES